MLLINAVSNPVQTNNPPKANQTRIRVLHPRDLLANLKPAWETNLFNRTDTFCSGEAKATGQNSEK